MSKGPEPTSCVFSQVEEGGETRKRKRVGWDEDRHGILRILRTPENSTFEPDLPHHHAKLSVKIEDRIFLNPFSFILIYNC